MCEHKNLKQSDISPTLYICENQNCEEEFEIS